MSSETSAVNVHGAWSAKRLTLLAMMLALISVSSYIAIPLPFSDAKITAQTMIVNLIGLLIAPQDTILVMASWLLLGLCGVPVFSGGSAGPGKLLGPSGGYYIGFLRGRSSAENKSVEKQQVPEMEKCCIPDSVPDCSWYSGDLRIRCRLDETRDRTAVGCSYRAVDNSVYSAGHR